MVPEPYVAKGGFSLEEVVAFFDGCFIADFGKDFPDFDGDDAVETDFVGVLVSSRNFWMLGEDG